MKTLKNHTLIYDSDCPMCCVYTSAFMKAGILDNEGREAFNSDLYPENPNFDSHKAQNEIALINKQTGEVQYGIDSMFTVIGHTVPALKPLFRFNPFKWVMKKVYSFISFNRKVIAPPPKQRDHILCMPDVNLKYRWLYVIFAALTAAIVSTVGLKLNTHESYFKDFSGEAVVAIIIAFRFALQAVITRGNKTKLMDYLGNLATINLQLAFLVGLGFFLNNFYEFGSVFIIIGGVYANFIHVKRLQSIGLNPWLCLAWNAQWVLIVATMAVLWT